MNLSSRIKHHALVLLLLSLTFSNAVPLMAQAEEQATTALPAQLASHEARLSEKLESPKRDDFAHLANYWLEYYAPRTLNQSVEEQLLAKTHAMLLPAVVSGEKETLPEPSKRINLLKDLQSISSTDKKSVLTGIDKTVTQAGKLSLFTMLATENTNWVAIKERQKFIKLLIDTPHLLNEIQGHLRNIQKDEALSLEALYHAEELRAAKELRRAKLLQTGVWGSIILGFSDFLENTFYKIDGLNTFFITVATTLTLCAIPFYAGFAIAHLAIITGTTAYFYSETAVRMVQDLGTWLSTKIVAIPSTLLRIIVALPFLAFAFFILPHLWFISTPELLPTTFGLVIRCIAVTYYGYCIYACGVTLRERHQRFKKSFVTMQSLASTYLHAKALHQTLANAEETANLYPSFLEETSSKWKTLAGKLETSTFKAGNSFWFLGTHHGRIENGLTLLSGIRNEIGQIERFYGELDAYASMAQFYLDHQETSNNFNENIRCCAVDFIEDSAESILHAEKFWHPIIATDNVRPSTLFLGGPKHVARNLVVTGPNAGGKSVNLKALLVNLMMAQAFGFACAESFRFTPFTKIIARFNSVDDTSGDKSKFMLEAIEMAGLLKEMMSLKPTEHAFVETDELFTGTEVGPAISLSIELCVRIAQMKNVMYILATHYKQLTDLKLITGNVFDNYKVSVFKEPASNKLVYPYALTRGIGNTNVAFDIFLEQLEKQGIDDPTLLEVITKAKTRQETIERSL